jgi:hypothetical protein
VLAALVQVGLLSALDLGMYRLHPALPAYLAYSWQEQAGEAFAVERQAARGALLGACADLGHWLLEQIQLGSAEKAFTVLEQERRTLGELAAWALEAGRYGEAQALLQPLIIWWDARGLHVEADRWVERCRARLEGADGRRPDFETEAGSLWLLMVVSQANRMRSAGELTTSEAIYEEIRQALEAGPAQADAKPRLATTCHQLGTVTQARGDLDGAAD